MGAAIKWIEQGAVEPRIEMRRSVRANAFLCVDLCTESDFWTGLSMNISEGGMFVATHVALPTGALVGLHFELPRHPPRIMTLGEVRWSREYTGNDDVPPGLGIRFVGLDEASILAIRKFVASIREPAR
jgi:uncharacterized protein (TIGR02266 family)